MAFDACVRTTLCTLTVNELQALDGAVTATLAEIANQETELAHQTAVAEAELATVQAQLDQAEENLGGLTAAFKLLPPTTIEGCTDLGDTLQDLNDVGDASSGPLFDFRQDKVRLSSAFQELQTRTTRLAARKAKFEELQPLITECITEVETA